MGKKSIHRYIQAQMVALHHAALNQVQISKQCNVSRCCIQNVIKKDKQLGQFDDLKHTGRTNKLSDREIRHLERLVKGDSRFDASKIATDLNASLTEPVTTRTIRRYLKDRVFEYVVKIEKQWLSAHHRQDRIAWCKKYFNWTKDDWRKVIFFRQIDIVCIKTKNSMQNMAFGERKTPFRMFTAN